MIINYPKMLTVYKVDFIDKKAKKIKRCKLKEWNNLFTFNSFIHVTENFIEGGGDGGRGYVEGYNCERTYMYMEDKACKLWKERNKKVKTIHSSHR